MDGFDRDDDIPAPGIRPPRVRTGGTSPVHAADECIWCVQLREAHTRDDRRDAPHRGGSASFWMHAGMAGMATVAITAAVLWMMLS
ncbi:hypothetical protein H1V43_17570 [Streptomyces sp. PSKA54]|uniref:Uncharacterized protein n=1 Tax=Streptomyces himalayensis subsp. aureolus TaxID=2758039 RepID=A0A7W2HGN7_9ACTN|nr:hypothetical protein [Streptomyces himalayensis]MBA4863158.1 hypothetical protein [Streptomyces himalayensis subsp. aureolus]